METVPSLCSMEKRVSIADIRLCEPDKPCKYPGTRVRGKPHYEVPEKIGFRPDVVKWRQVITFYQHHIDEPGNFYQVIGADLGYQDVLGVEFNHLGTFNQRSPKKVTFIPESDRLRNGDSHLVGPEVGKREVDHVVPDRPVLENKEVMLCPDYPLINHLDGLLTGDHPLDTLYQLHLVLPDTKTRYRQCVLLFYINGAGGRAGHIHVTRRAFGLLTLMTAFLALKHGFCMFATMTPVFVGHGLTRRTPAAASLDNNDTPVLVGDQGMGGSLLE